MGFSRERDHFLEAENWSTAKSLEFKRETAAIKTPPKNMFQKWLINLLQRLRDL